MYVRFCEVDDIAACGPPGIAIPAKVVFRYLQVKNEFVEIIDDTNDF